MKKLYPSALRFMKPYLPANLKCICDAVIEIRQFNRMEKKKKEEEREEHGHFEEITFRNIAHIVH